MRQGLAMAFVLSVVVLFIDVNVAVSAEVQEDAVQKLNKAEQLLTRGKAKAAALLLHDVIRSNPNNGQAHALLGASMAARVDDNKYDEAIAEEQLALKLDPGSFWARKVLGKIYANQHRVPESIEILKEACRLKPDSYAAWKDLGTVYMSDGKLDDAIEAFKKAKDAKPAGVDAHLKLALLFSKKGDLPKAIAEARDSVRFGEKQAETHLTLATMLLESGDRAGAIDSFNSAIAANGYDALGCLNPLTQANALSGLGWAIAGNDASKDQLNEAVQDQRKAIKAFPSFLPAYVRWADLLCRQQRHKEAESVYITALKMSSGSTIVAVPYAKFLGQTGRNAQACSLLKNIVDKSPDNKPASDALSELQKNAQKK